MEENITVIKTTMGLDLNVQLIETHSRHLDQRVHNFSFDI